MVNSDLPSCRRDLCASGSLDARPASFLLWTDCRNTDDAVVTDGTPYRRSSPPGFLWLVVGVYALDFPYVLGLHSAVLATTLVVLYSRYGNSLDSRFSPSSGRRLATGVLIGTAVGGSLAALILLLASIAHQSPELIDFVSGGTRDRLDPSTEILLSVCTGAVDGALIAILGVKGSRPKYLDGAVVRATT